MECLHALYAFHLVTVGESLQQHVFVVHVADLKLAHAGTTHPTFRKLRVRSAEHINQPLQLGVNLLNMKDSKYFISLKKSNFQSAAENSRELSDSY